MSKKSKIIDLLSAKKRLTYREIAEKVGCRHTYVGNIAIILNLTKRKHILDFRGLLKGGEKNG